MTQAAKPAAVLPLPTESMLVPEPEHGRFDFFGMLRRRKWLILFGLVVGIGLGVLYFMKAPIYYGGDSEIYVQKKAPNLVSVAGSKSIVPELRFESHEKVIASEFMVDRTMNGYGNEILKELPSFRGMSDGMIKNKILRGLEVIPDRDDPNVYNVYYQCQNPSDCKHVLDALLETYRGYLSEEQSGVVSELEDLIDDARDDLEIEIANLRAEHRKFREDNTSVVFDNEGTIINSEFEELKRLDAEISDLSKRKSELEVDLNWIDEELAAERSRNVLIFLLERNEKERISDSLDRPGLDSTEQQHVMRLFDMQFTLDDMLLRFGADHPDVKAQELRIQRYMAEWNRMMGGPVEQDNEEPLDVLALYVESMREQINNIDRLLEINQAEFAKTLEKSQELSTLQQEETGFQTQFARLDKTHEKILELLSEARMQQNQEGYDFEILSDPPVQARQVAPNIVRVMAVACFLGLALGGGLAYLVDVADKTFRSPNEITQMMHLPLVGHIPVISRDSQTDYTESRIDPTVVSYHRPKSKMAEAYRAVRTSIYFSQQGEEHKVLQVTSPSPGDGKTTLACNLAVSIANSGKRVIIVDADLRRPRVHQVLGEDSDVGFAAVLAGEAEPDDATIQTEVKNLSLMPCGARPSNPAELLTTRRLPELLDLLREKYDYVIVDSPPVLAVTDPCAVAPRVDATVLTFRIKKNIKLAAERAREILDSVGGNVAGIVVNGVGGGTPMSSNRYGYGGYGNRYYNYSYSYGSTGDYDFGYVDDYYDDEFDDEPQRPRIEASNSNGRK